jgi:vacuolar-type H+-ATPase subunit H
MQVRKEKRVLKEDASLQRMLVLQRKREQRAAIKAAEEEARKIRVLLREKQVEEAKRNYQNRLQVVEMEALRREQEVARMERVEMELIQQLKNTQMLQKAALEDLETALKVEA